MRFNSVICRKEALEFKHYVDDILDDSIYEVSTARRPYLDLFGPVMCRENRFDLLLPLDDVVLRVAQNVLRQLSPLIIEVRSTSTSSQSQVRPNFGQLHFVSDISISQESPSIFFFVWRSRATVRVYAS